MRGAQGHRLVIGIGNPDRGDDAAGRRVAQLLRGQHCADVEICELDGESTTLVARLEGAASAWIVDACRAGAPAGTIHRFDLTHASLPPMRSGLSTHGMGLSEAIELARALGRLPGRCIVYALEAQHFRAGSPLSAPVAEAVAVAATRISAELRSSASP